MNKWNIFGSEDSTDLDVMVYLDEMPDSLEDCKILCKKLNEELKPIINDPKDRELDCNICVLKNGVIDKVFKGIPSETNNSIYITYYTEDFNGLQKYPCQIYTTKIDYNWPTIKIARVLRVMLSFLSRTKHRKIVKAALKGSTQLKIDTLKSINLVEVRDFGKNNQNREDIWKTYAFQIGQSLGLFWGDSLFTKSIIADQFPFLRPFLYRKEDADPKNMEIIKNFYLMRVETEYKDLDKISE